MRVYNEIKKPRSIAIIKQFMNNEIGMYESARRLSISKTSFAYMVMSYCRKTFGTKNEVKK